ncbi:hypothetical protein ABAZ39_33065 (plasmid) [Azospirillum argentinense]|uniref:Uncharacterized protein n=1 Tax=Azospirillum argentinense TaxID=2970906 RepID=A0A060E109_9PROT|nr:hypothetical protein [Azospirillum argentinense]AIB16669.1 hypothetical protein ABAZ39_33065 [Azospirillum argentinense]EZQ02354.1 hypothetical protein ABAZ39_32730 [Azospirillum argentinense]
MQDIARGEHADDARLAAAFEKGDYTTVAMSPRNDLWRVAAARGLIGLTDAALTVLSALDGDEIRFYRGVARWIGGDEDGARWELAPLTSPHARGLLSLIERPRIPVLSMLADGGETCLTLKAGAAADKKFDIVNIGYSAGDRRNRLGAAVTDYVDLARLPAFFLCQMIEWHQFPAQLAALNCPLIGQTSDFFVHIQSVAPWIRLFDEIIVTDHSEHAAAHPLSSAPVSTFPKSYGVPFSLPAYRETERPIDVLMTGTAVSPYHPEKAEILRQLTSMDGLRLAIVNGHLTTAAYHDLLSRSKFTVSHYRCGGGLVTRSLEAAALGCVPLIQHDNVLMLYAGDDPALVVYDLENDGVAAALAAAMERYPVLAPRLAPSATALRTALDPQVGASQYLRFATFLAARPRSRMRPAADPIAKRAMFWKGWMPGNGNPGVVHRLRRVNATRWAEQGETSQSVNEICREMLLEVGSRLLRQAGGDLLIEETLATYRKGMSRFPRALALRFNAIRSAIHYGGTAAVAQATEWARSTVAAGHAAWDLTCDDDVLPYDFAGKAFNYRVYLDLLTDAAGGATVPVERLKSLIFASLAHYVAKIDDDLPHARMAVAFDDQFPSYRLTLAKLLAEGTAAERTEAADMLTRLCDHPLVGPEASYVLRRLLAEGAVLPFDAQRALALAQRFMHAMTDTEAYLQRQHGPFLAAMQVATGGVRGLVAKRRRAPQTPPAVSIIVVDAAGALAAATLAALERQTFNRRRMEIISVDVFDRIGPAARAIADVAAACNADGCLPHENRAGNEGLLLAGAERVLVLASGAEPDPGLVERMLRRLPQDSGLASSPVIVDCDPASGSIRALCARRVDLHLLGGFDPHHAYYAMPLGLDDLLRRARLAQIVCETPNGRPAEPQPRFRTSFAREVVRGLMFPGIDAPDRAWPRHETLRLGTATPSNSNE